MEMRNLHTTIGHSFARARIVNAELLTLRLISFGTSGAPFHINKSFFFSRFFFFFSQNLSFSHIFLFVARQPLLNAQVRLPAPGSSDGTPANVTALSQAISRSPSALDYESRTDSGEGRKSSLGASDGGATTSTGHHVKRLSSMSASGEALIPRE
jgi:hypothetical protein